MRDFSQILRSKGLKATNERIGLLQILHSAKKPLSISEILSLDKKSIMNQATVYRALDSFITAKIVKQINLNRESALFELIDPADHHHLVCLDCGRVEDFKGCDFENLSKKALAKSKNFRIIRDHSLEIFGLCKTCVII